ncbi:MAG: cupin domain-containing protein [Acidobacteria bacterium]|jgi:quercetin dioxygenase-like cupin family protein|nr:cupin domain-containing protein [Acidobacteriota bacterium]
MTLPSREEGSVNALSTSDEIKVGEVTIRFVLEGDDSAGTLAAFEFAVPAGARVAAAHSHDAYDETIYGIDGVLTWTVDGTATDVGPGEALWIPRGVVHRFDNAGYGDAKALAVVTPGVLGPDYFREVAAVLDRATAGPPDLAAVAAVMIRHGLTPAS